MASLDNTKINEIRFINTFFDQRIKNKLSIYVDDLEKLEKIESNKIKRDIRIFVSTVFGSIVIGSVLKKWGYNITAECFFICFIILIATVCGKRIAEINTSNTIINSFKNYIILQLLHQNGVITFKQPIDDVGFEFVNDVLDEIHLFDSSIYIIDHISYTADKKIESISLKNVDSEKLKKIINLNAITNFSYAPI